MDAKAAIQKMGKSGEVSRRYGYKQSTVANWARRGIPAHVLIDDKRLARALKRAGYNRNEQAVVQRDRRVGAEPGHVMPKQRATNGTESA